MISCHCHPQYDKLPLPPTAGVPGQVWQGGEGGNQVEEGPGNDDTVVDVQKEDDGHRRYAHTYNMVSGTTAKNAHKMKIYFFYCYL